MEISLIFCLVVVLILAACIYILLRAYEKLKKLYEALRESYSNVEKLNSELRAQRHDYLNHLQVVYGLMELEEYEDLQSYLEPMFKDMQKTGKALKTSKPAINALLKAKMDEAESKGIDLYVEVKSDLRELSVEDWELCKVLANLIDNSITALEKTQGEKKICIDVTEDKAAYQFIVADNGPGIEKHLQENIFKQGFSTKSEEGHGMGLYIVANVIKNYKGTIELKSEEETVFTVRFPKDERR